MRRVVVLGNNGFLGKNLMQEFPQATGVSLRDNTWERDIENSDVIINLIGKAHDHKGTANEKEYYVVNVELTKRIFNAFLKSSSKVLIHISSIAAIQEYNSNKYLKEDDFCNPISWYGKSKREAEIWLLSQNLPPNKKIIILRPPMIHGPHDKGNLGLLFKFINNGIPYPFSNFENSRSFISIVNFCYFLRELIESDNDIESGIYHVSDDEPLSTKEIIHIMKEVTRKRVLNISLPKFFIRTIAWMGDYLPLPLNTIRLKKMTSNLLVSNDKIKNALGLKDLKLSAKDGLILTIKSFQNGDRPK